MSAKANLVLGNPGKKMNSMGQSTIKGAYDFDRPTTRKRGKSAIVVGAEPVPPPDQISGSPAKTRKSRRQKKLKQGNIPDIGSSVGNCTTETMKDLTGGTRDNGEAEVNIGTKRTAVRKEPSPKKAKTVDAAFEDAVQKAKNALKMRQYKIPKKKVVSSDKSESSNRRNNSKGIGGSTIPSTNSNATSKVSSNQIKQPIPMTYAMMQVLKNRDQKLASNESKGTKRKAERSNNADLEDLETRKRLGLEAPASATAGTTSSTPNINAVPTISEPSSSKILVPNRRAKVKLKRDTPENIHNGISSHLGGELQPPSLPPTIKESAIPQPGCSKDAKLVFNTEEMDFDNPVPEILQMVTEANASDLDSQNGNDVFDEMEVDSVAAVSTKRSIVVIPDTNVWIGDRPLIQEILSMNESGKARSSCLDLFISIVIPWMVLQELDYSIHRNKIANKRREFQGAAKYIHSLLSKKDIRVRGQKAADAAIGVEFNELMADDSILNCVIQHDRNPQFSTVFITNDINLLNKAMVHNLTAFKADATLIEKLRQLSCTSEWKSDISNFDSFTTSGSPFGTTTPTEETESAPPQNQNPMSYLSFEDFGGMDVDDPMGEDCNQNQDSLIHSRPVPALNVNKSKKPPFNQNIKSNKPTSNQPIKSNKSASNQPIISNEPTYNPPIKSKPTYTYLYSMAMHTSEAETVQSDPAFGTVAPSLTFNAAQQDSTLDSFVPAPTFEVVIEELRKSLTHIIVPKMVEEYGTEEWKFAIKIKPPFSVDSGLRCLQQHWIAVFSFIFPQRGQDVLDKLLGAFKNKPDNNEDAIKSWRLEFCRNALVFLSMSATLVKKPRILETIKLLQSYVDNT